MAANPLPTSSLTFVTEETPNEATIRCSGKITMENTDELRDAARKLIAESKRLMLDFSDVSYLDSSGLGMIVGLYVSAKRAKCQLKVINLSPRVKEIFTLTRLEEALSGREEYLGATPD